MDLITPILMAQPQNGEANPWISIMPFALILIVLYFFIFRPQAQKAKKQREFKEKVQKGDKVVTIGGIHGKITDEKENSFILDAGNNVKLQIEKSAVSVEATESAYGKK